MDIVKYYIVAATVVELAPTLAYCKKKYISKNDFYITNKNIQVHIIISGIGGATTIHNLHKQNVQDGVVIQAGIAGSYNYNIALGNVFTISADRFADVGAEDNETYLDIYDIGLEDKNNSPYTNGWLFNTELPYPMYFRGLSNVTSITVNRATGKQSTIDYYTKAYRPTLESMEGAAVHLYCLENSLPFIQLRSVSNYITIRDKSGWQIPLAIKNLNEYLIDFLETL